MIIWESSAEIKYRQLIEKIPVFMRGIAEERITKKVHSIVSAANRQEITEKDMVDAFFAETPFGFHGPMKSDMESIGIDYIKYGYDK